jgi:hypothetical protein
MKKILLLISTIFLNFYSKAFAWNVDTWIFWECATKTQIRNWGIDIDTIPCLLDSGIDFLMGIAWTISVIFIIIGAYQMLFWSLAKDNAKWKTTIIFAISWFVLASFSWAIIKFILDNFGA